ncbi:MAG: tripartite tricarboxylate transporter substrate-binding protein [Burkholderiaceae bacterium]
MKKFVIATAFAVGALIAGQAAAFDTVKIMIPANPGGGYDQTGRGLGVAMQAAGVAKTVTYENKGGSGGVIGLAQFVNNDKGNPNALLVMGAVMVGAIETNKPPVTLKNATPVARLFGDAMVVVVPASSKLTSMKDLVAQLKDKPGSVSWSGGSRGSIDHILAALIAKDAGVDPTKVNYIPSAGGGESAAAIIGAQVTVGLAGYSEFAQHLKSGKMRALAVSSATKLPGEKTATLKEQGINIEIYNWRGVYGAPGITEAQQKALIDAVVAATKTPAWSITLEKNEWTPLLLTGAEFGQFVDAESARIGALLKEVGIAK